ncbi:MAG: hypothetical protein ABSG01_02095 [Anaerolineales bacterium]
MLKVRKVLLLSIVLLSLACGLFSQTLPGTQTPNPTLPPPAAVTNAPDPTATLAPSPTLTSTQIPTVAPTATVDPLAATQQALMGSMGAITDISLYLRPVGIPLSSWRSVPIMAQATAGQEYPGNIYSYSAAATLDQARQFYVGKSQSLGFIMAPGTGYAGTGVNASHDVSFISYPLTIYMTSYDNDPGHVTVVISKLP